MPDDFFDLRFRERAKQGGILDVKRMGVTVTYNLLDVAGSGITGNFTIQDTSIEDAEDSSEELKVTFAIITVDPADVTSPSVDDTFTVDGDKYSVIDIPEDGSLITFNVKSFKILKRGLNTRLER